MAQQNLLLADAGLEDTSMLPQEKLSEQTEIDVRGCCASAAKLRSSDFTFKAPTNSLQVHLGIDEIEIDSLYLDKEKNLQIKSNH
jgi:hypothetical protein